MQSSLNLNYLDAIKRSSHLSSFFSIFSKSEVKYDFFRTIKNCIFMFFSLASPLSEIFIDVDTKHFFVNKALPAVEARWQHKIMKTLSFPLNLKAHVQLCSTQHPLSHALKIIQTISFCCAVSHHKTFQFFSFLATRSRTTRMHKSFPKLTKNTRFRVREVF